MSGDAAFFHVTDIGEFCTDEWRMSDYAMGVQDANAHVRHLEQGDWLPAAYHTSHGPIEPRLTPEQEAAAEAAFEATQRRLRATRRRPRRTTQRVRAPERGQSDPLPKAIPLVNRRHLYRGTAVGLDERGNQHRFRYDRERASFDLCSCGQPLHFEGFAIRHGDGPQMPSEEAA